MQKEMPAKLEQSKVLFDILPQQAVLETQSPQTGSTATRVSPAYVLQGHRNRSMFDMRAPIHSAWHARRPTASHERT
jgi:hypothetical protein